MIAGARYLAAAGVGRLGIVDHDVVDVSNLHRQVAHTEARAGRSKAESAREAGGRGVCVGTILSLMGTLAASGLT